MRILQIFIDVDMEGAKTGHEVGAILAETARIIDTTYADESVSTEYLHKINNSKGERIGSWSLR